MDFGRGFGGGSGTNLGGILEGIWAPGIVLGHPKGFWGGVPTPIIQPPPPPEPLLGFFPPRTTPKTPRGEPSPISGRLLSLWGTFSHCGTPSNPPKKTPNPFFPPPRNPPDGPEPNPAPIHHPPGRRPLRRPRRLHPSPRLRRQAQVRGGGSGTPLKNPKSSIFC